MRHLKQPHDAILKMPTYERRFFLLTLQNEIEETNERVAASKGKTKSTGKGTRTSTISGQALKSKISEGKIPQ